MTTKTLTALKESIAHWTRLATCKLNKGEGIGPDNCALCLAFFSNNCRGCPVRDHTGKHCCRGTPYSLADNAWENHGLDSPQFKAAALKELKFLKSLLPKKAVKR